MIEIKQLRKQYPHSYHSILDGIDYIFPDKGFFTILGETGCGKSTLLKCLAGLTAYEGEILLDNRNPSEARAKDIGFIFQDFKLDEEETVLQSVMDDAIVAGFSISKAKERAEDALRRCGVESLEEKKTSALSFGQKQRVSIARAIVKSPRYLFADEPTGNLDEDNAKEIMKLLFELSSDSLVIVVTHQKELIESYSYTILRLENGNLKEEHIRDGSKDSTTLYKSDNKNIHEKKVNPISWIFKTRVSSSKHSFLFAIALFIITLLSGISTQLTYHSIQSHEKISASYYTDDTYSLYSDSIMQLTSNEMLNIYTNPDTALLDPCSSIITLQTGIKISPSNFSFITLPPYIREDNNAFSIYALDYDKAKKCEFGKNISDPKDGIIIDQSILDKMNDCIIDENHIIQGNFTLYDQKLNGEYQPKTWKITDISHTGFPFVILKNINSLSFNYHYREGFTHSLDELSMLDIIDANSLPSGYSLETNPNTKENECYIYLNEKAKEIVSDWDIEYLGISSSTYGTLNGTKEDKPIIALYDVIQNSDEDSEAKIVLTKENFFYLLLKASRNMNDVRTLNDKEIKEGRKAKKENEYVVSDSFVKLLGGIENANNAVSSLNVTIVGTVDVSWNEIYGCGDREYLSKLLGTGNYMTRFPSEKGRIDGAPRLISYDIEKTRAWFDQNKRGQFQLKKTVELVKAYDKKETLSEAKRLIIFFLIIFLTEIIFLFAISLTHALSLHDFYYINHCLGYKNKDLIIGTMLVTLVQYGLPIIVSTLLLTIYLAIFKILLSYWMIIVILIYLLLMLCVHTVTSFFHLMHCKKE